MRSTQHASDASGAIRTAGAYSADDIAAALCRALPPGVARGVAVAWEDPQLGLCAGRCPCADLALQRCAMSLADEREALPATPLSLRWRSADGAGLMVLSTHLAHALEPALQHGWQELARALLQTALDKSHQLRQIRELEQSKRLQQALYHITDLAGADLDMPQMLERIHQILCTLMYAQNCYIVEYDDVAGTIRFLYFADQQDDFVADPGRRYREHEMPRSLTFALLRSGHAMRGPSEHLRASLQADAGPIEGPESLDWLGVPMYRENRVCGAIVVQSYDKARSYDDGDRALLDYVAKHVLTAMDRRNAQSMLEHEVQARTRELQRANHHLHEEVIERRRAEKLQRALFQISELSMQADSPEYFHSRVHAIVGTLLDASNFYIALVSDDGEQLVFVYSVDEHSPTRKTRPLGRGLTEYVLRHRRALLVMRGDIQALWATDEVQESGMPSHCWLGIPLFGDGEVIGAVVVQSYSEQVVFTQDDQRLLTFVAQNVARGLVRQRDQEQLRQAHAQLERRVIERTQELAKLNEQLLDQISERLRAEQLLTHQAMHDALTGLPNRLHLLERIEHAVARAGLNAGMGFAVLFLDLDRFKVVNDSIGHAAGDQLLVEVARRIVSAVRDDDVVARLGGDEFAILLSNVGDGRDALDFGERLLTLLEESMWVEGRELFPSGSLGIAVWHPRYSGAAEMLRDADAAMYRAKAQGQARCALFDQAMHEAALRSLDLESDLRRAIINHDFQAYYQPIVRLSDGEVIGHEALLRWQHESRGLLLPGAFMEQGAETGLIEQVDWLLYAQVVEQLARGGDGYISMNVSPHHFRMQDFVTRLFDMLDAAGADPRRLRMEITEVALLDDAPRTLRILQQLRDRGVLIQLDDFGTGFSALSYLHRFPISTLKIDRSFVASLHETEGQNTLALVRGVLSLAATLGIETIGEGIETEAQRRTLAELGCVYGQGYLLGRPQPRQQYAVA